MRGMSEVHTDTVTVYECASCGRAIYTFNGGWFHIGLPPVPACEALVIRERVLVNRRPAARYGY